MAFEKPNFTRVPNEFFDKYLHKLSGLAVQVFLIIVRKTEGFHKKKDNISLTQLEKSSGLARNSVIKAVKELVEKDMITVLKIKNRTNTFSIKFKEGSARIELPKEDDSARIKPVGSARIEHTKDILLKKKELHNILKKYMLDNSKELHGKSYYHDKKEAKQVSNIINMALSMTDNDFVEAKKLISIKLDIFMNWIEVSDSDFKAGLTFTPSTLRSLWNNLEPKREVLKRAKL